LDPGKDSLLYGISKVDVLRKRVVRFVGLNNRPHILFVGRNFDSVGVVGRKSLNFLAQILRPEELSDVGDWTVPDLDSAVGRNRCIGVGKKVGVCGSAFVVSREDGLKLNHTIMVADLDTTEERSVEASLGAYARVNTSGIAVPDISSQVRNSSTGRYVDVLNL
jgi:hypothetical protein